MKKITTYVLFLLLAGFALQSCKDDETYAEQKEKERKAIAAFLSRTPIQMFSPEGQLLLQLDNIKVIDEETFDAQDSTTDVSQNEFVLLRSSGIYMQIVRKGVGEKMESGESKQIICRYWEYNILGDSMQTSNKVPFFATNPDIIDVTNNSGTFSASFNTDICGGGAMYIGYKGLTAVPSGWLKPLPYINIGRQTTAEEGIAKVRIIVPHSEGHTDATQNVYPCFYEITYQEMREY